jgi:1-deoxy-D-xylulose-5-phosphate synthase
VIVRSADRDVLIVAVGPMVATSVEVAQRLADEGVGATVVDPRWVKPFDPAIVDLASDFRLVGQHRGQLRHRWCRLRRWPRPCATPMSRRPIRVYGIPARFLPHGNRAALLQEIGLTAEELSRDIANPRTRARTTSSASASRSQTRPRDGE